ncbi:MAG: 50S ribosomal protein L19 [Termitinemataceae bacterium]|nr:MAG: 50S ribosomal protein L19 [Termitinemataceae bacterium]
MDIIRAIEESQMKEGMNVFKVGDTVKVHFKILESGKERIQIYEGLVIAFKNSGVGRSFTVRKNSHGVGVERVFPLHSPRVVQVEVSRSGRVRRAKLYYIRTKIGKAAKIKELLGKKSTLGKSTPNRSVVAAQQSTATEEKKAN